MKTSIYLSLLVLWATQCQKKDFIDFFSGSETKQILNGHPHFNYIVLLEKPFKNIIGLT